MADEPFTAADEAIPSIPQRAQTFEFSTEQLDRFFQAKWKDNPCEICGSQSWSYGNMHPYISLPVTDGKNNGVPSPWISIAFRIICTNCGNMKFLLAAVIQHWLDSNS